MFAMARSRQRSVTMAYRSYVCDSLQAQGQGMVLAKRFADLLQPRQEIDVDAIIEGVISSVEG